MEKMMEGNNSTDRAKVIRETIEQIQGLEAQAKSINAQIRAIKATKIKGELSMKIGDFNAALRLAGLDQDDRDTFLDTIRETFSALAVGTQMDFLTVGEAESPAAAAVELNKSRKGRGPSTKKLEQIYAAGYRAGVQQAPHSYPKTVGDKFGLKGEFDRGYMDGARDTKEKEKANAKTAPEVVSGDDDTAVDDFQVWGDDPAEAAEVSL